jgi:hypothetical protein
MSTVLAAVAVIIALASAVFTGLAVGHARRSADAAEASERQQRTPILVVDLEGHGAPEQVPQAYYRVRNDGPQALDQVTIHRPRPLDGIGYWIAHSGETAGPDELDLGGLPLGQSGRFTLFCGAAPELPEFRVRIVCTSGRDRWELLKLLPAPRPLP